MVAPTAPAWSPIRRVAFRFAFLFTILFVLPLPMDTPPAVGWLSELASKPFDPGVNLLGRLFDQPVPIEPTDMGDTLYRFLLSLQMVLLAAIGTIVWSVVDRRRENYERIAEVPTIVVRYFLVATMLYYGVAKLIGAQFPFPNAGMLEAKVSETSPMGLMWAFMGYSAPYSFFGGLAEVLGALLLLSRRTTTLGALVIMAVMTNVVMLNLCYDITVKLFSFQLWLASVALLAPHARRLIAAALGFATSAAPSRPRWSARGVRVRRAGKVLLLLVFAYQCWLHVTWWDKWVDEHSPEIAGIWMVEQQPEAPSAERWLRIAIWEFGIAVRFGDDTRKRYGVDFEANTNELLVYVDRTGKPERWRYHLIAPDRLELDALREGRPMHLTLRREPAGKLATHETHWVLR
jgi:hypothetical protein